MTPTSLDAALAAASAMKKAAFQPMMDPQAPPGVDPATGQPMGLPPGVDPATGQPMGLPPGVDPATGQPIPAGPPVDPATGQPMDPNAQPPGGGQQDLEVLMSALDQLTNIVQQQQQQLQQLGQAQQQVQGQLQQIQEELKQTSQLAISAGQEVAQLAKILNSQPDMPAGMAGPEAGMDPSMGGQLPLPGM